MKALALLLALSAPASAAPDWAALGRETKEHLVNLIRIDTSNPPGNEIAAAYYLKGVLDPAGIANEILVATGTRASLVARVKGAGSKRPLLLICHTDVVPAEAKDWSVPPFAAVEKDGYLYGRGAGDIKSMCAAELVVLLELKRQNAALARDVIFLAQADEESGAADSHALWLTKNHAAKISAELGINEGGFTLWKDGRIASFELQVAEKRYVDLKLVARGPTGHSSLPNDKNAVHALVRAAARLSEWKAPRELTPAAAATLAGGAMTAGSPEAEALQRDTCAVTILKAGYKSNVVPAEAQAEVNCRLLPGRALAPFLAEIKRVIAEPAVEVRYEGPAFGTLADMPFDHPFVADIQAAAREAAPGAPVRPYMSIWSTDAGAYRSLGIKVYGLDPPLTLEDVEGVHGNDERIPLAAIEPYTKLLYLLTQRSAGR
ncbi:MAG: M20/M25/M40 family metallo-hydrolase [Elusimicrobia bacterium]|nr:M20/M25/M40 family metallo-hydrolase [Elusimicrobiota bacterium]